MHSEGRALPRCGRYGKNRLAINFFAFYCTRCFWTSVSSRTEDSCVADTLYRRIYRVQGDGSAAREDDCGFESRAANAGLCGVNEWLRRAVELIFRRDKSSGFALIELIVAATILIILSGMALPLARVSIKREKERQLRFSLLEMRGAIDRYKERAERGAIQLKVGSDGYPPDLETLVQGVEINGKKFRFLREIPIDPMTRRAHWGCVPSKMIPTQTPGTETASPTFIQNPKAQLWTERGTETGRCSCVQPEDPIPSSSLRLRVLWGVGSPPTLTDLTDSEVQTLQTGQTFVAKAAML